MALTNVKYLHPKAKIPPSIIKLQLKSTTFAALLAIKALGLGYGVMVTQQVLVLFFLVRIRVSQPKKGGSLQGESPFLVIMTGQRHREKVVFQGRRC